jgi:hypothetical protein
VFGLHFFESDIWVAGRRTRAGVEARWRPGPFSFAAEFMTLADQRSEQSLMGTDLPPFRSRGWYASGAWRMPAIGRVGSIQLATRVEQFSLGRTSNIETLSTSPRAERILGNGETALTIGATWRPNRWTAVQGNLVDESIGIDRRLGAPAIHSWSRLLQVQLGI